MIIRGRMPRRMPAPQELYAQAQQALEQAFARVSRYDPQSQARMYALRNYLATVRPEHFNPREVDQVQRQAVGQVPPAMAQEQVRGRQQALQQQAQRAQQASQHGMQQVPVRPTGIITGQRPQQGLIQQNVQWGAAKPGLEQVPQGRAVGWQQAKQLVQPSDPQFSQPPAHAPAHGVRGTQPSTGNATGLPIRPFPQQQKQGWQDSRHDNPFSPQAGNKRMQA